MNGGLVDNGLRGANVLVVGASSGIGRAFAAAAMRAGAEVCVAARREHALVDLVTSENSGHVVVGDVADPQQCRTIVERAAAAMGGLDVVMYAVGVTSLGPIELASPGDWARDFAVNVIGATQITAAALQHLSTDGIVAFLSSEITGEPRWGLSSYMASKCALDATIRAWRVEHPQRRFTRVVMGATIGTDFANDFDMESLGVAMQRWGASGIDSGLMDVDNVGVSLARTLGVMWTLPEVDMPDVQLDPRGSAWP
jgi:NAD(P)-dependent dehydrogenase (short-subunit alcohol dehydrogenase family)